MEPKLFRRWGKERGMFRDDHFDNGYAAHRLFTEKFGDFTLKTYRLSPSGIFQAYPTTPLEEIKTHAAICADPPRHRILPLDTHEAKPMIEHWPAGNTVGFESMVRPIIRSQDNDNNELDHFILRRDEDPSFIRESIDRQSLGYRINADHGANLLEIYLNQSQGGMCICRVLGIGAGVSRECFGP